jgi:putative spermidine/putrescine transport system substrate-binding protein
VSIAWVLHAAATTAIVAKIRAAWPNPPVDFINASEPTMFAMKNAGWLEPLTLAEIPNLAHVSPDLLIRNEHGETVTAAVSTPLLFWAYDEKAVGMRIEKPDDLLSPKLHSKIMLNAPTIGSGSQLISLAHARGGDEHNIEPGFAFVKDLIRANNIGAVVKTDVEIANAFTTGSIAIGLINTGNFHEIRQHVDLTLLNKAPGSPTFKTFTGFESVAVLKKNGNPKPVTDFINFALDAPNNTAYAAIIGTIPANELASVAPTLDPIRIHNAAERREFVMEVDHEFISRQTAVWNRKWELEIAPLL